MLDPVGVMLPPGTYGSGRVVVQIDRSRFGDNFTAVVVAAGRANVVRALQFAAAGAFVGVARNQSIMRAAHIAARAGHAVLLNGHGVNLRLGRAATGDPEG